MGKLPSDVTTAGPKPTIAILIFRSPLVEILGSTPTHSRTHTHALTHAHMLYVCIVLILRVRSAISRTFEKYIWTRTRPRAPVLNQHTRELISARNKRSTSATTKTWLANGNRRFPEITGTDNLTVFYYSGRVKSPEWRRQLRGADLREF